jgi:hypothetical protein
MKGDECSKKHEIFLYEKMMLTKCIHSKIY